MNQLYNGVITPEFFRLAQDSFLHYKEHKRQFDLRIIENNRWFKAQHLSVGEDIPAPTTAYLFNVIANKHADAMDNYPEPNILEREPEDRTAAEQLKQILPLQLEACHFKTTYSRAWWYKLKNGAACYGVFYNPTLNQGRGEIDIKKIDLLNLFWEPGVTDIQDSRFLFLTALTENSALRERYPQYAEKFSGNGNSIDVVTYDDCLNTNQEDIYKDKTMVIDCYYKQRRNGHTTVELLKFCGNTILEASEDNGDEGLYEHGKYPFVIDTMYPDEDSPVGFGLIDVIKSPQLYIDKLDHLISRNALIAGKTRFMVKDNGGINEYELTDVSNDVIHVAGSVNNDNIRELQTKPLHPYIIQHRQNKIAEMKEIAGNRDFQQGGTMGGVTAYSAITALQQAGEKLSRDMIQQGYEAYKDIVYLCIELIRQFYHEARCYRVNRTDGKGEYVNFSNNAFREQLHDGRHRAVFDISVSPQKSNPYSRIAQNQTMTELWKLGIFRPEMAEQSLLFLECMQFDGKERLIEGLQKLKEQAETAKTEETKQSPVSDAETAE